MLNHSYLSASVLCENQAIVSISHGCHECQGEYKEHTVCLALCIGCLYSCKKPQGEYRLMYSKAAEMALKAMDLRAWMRSCMCVPVHTHAFCVTHAHVCMDTIG